MSNVVELDTITRLDIPVERVLRRATEADLEHVVVIGWRKDLPDGEDEFYFASSRPGGPEVLWMLALAQKRLLEIGDSEE